MYICFLFTIWAVCITVAICSLSFMQWCSSDQLLSNEKKFFSTFGEPTSQEALILAEKCEPDENKSDEKEKDPTTTEPLDQVSDHKPDTITSTLRWPLISRLFSKQNMVDISGYAPEAKKSDEGEKSPEPMKPPDKPSDLGCLPEVIPTLASPPTKPVPEKKIGPIHQCLKELKLVEYGAEKKVEEAREEDKVSDNEKTYVKHQQTDKDVPQSEKISSKNQVKKKKNPLKVFQPLPGTYIPKYPCLKELLAEFGIQEDKLSGNEKADAKNEVQESTKKLFDQSGKDPPQSGHIPSKDKIIKKKITFNVTHPSPLQKKDWYLTLQVKEGSDEKQKIRIKTEKTSQNHEWTSPPLVFDVGKDETIVFKVKEKNKGFGFISGVLEKCRFSGLAKRKNGAYESDMLPFRSIIPDLKVKIKVEDILETITKTDSGKNKMQQKSYFIKN